MRGFIAALMPALAGATPLWDEPGLGSRFDTLDHRRYACAASATSASCWLQPGHGLSLQDVAARGRLLAYSEGRLKRSCTIFDERRLDELLKILEARHGPAEHSTELLRAGMGGVFSNRLAVWRLEDKVVLLEQYFERVTQSAVCVMDPDSFSAQMTTRERQRVRGVRDL